MQVAHRIGEVTLGRDDNRPHAFRRNLAARACAPVGALDDRNCHVVVLAVPQRAFQPGVAALMEHHCLVEDLLAVPVQVVCALAVEHVDAHRMPLLIEREVAGGPAVAGEPPPVHPPAHDREAAVVAEHVATLAGQRVEDVPIQPGPGAAPDQLHLHLHAVVASQVQVAHHYAVIVSAGVLVQLAVLDDPMPRKGRPLFRRRGAVLVAGEIVTENDLPGLGAAGSCNPHNHQQTDNQDMIRSHHNISPVIQGTCKEKVPASHRCALGKQA